MSADEPPDLYVIAGPNGSGKSTLIRALRSRLALLVIDPDAIALELRPQAREQAVISAARLAPRQQQAFLGGDIFLIETDTPRVCGRVLLLGARVSRPAWLGKGLPDGSGACSMGYGGSGDPRSWAVAVTAKLAGITSPNAIRLAKWLPVIARSRRGARASRTPS